MNQLTDTEHFFPIEALPRLPLTSTLRRVFSVLSEKDVGALVAEDEGQPIYYMTADYCKIGVVTLANRHGWSLAAIHTLHDILTDPELKPDLDQANQFSGVVPIPQRPIFETDDPESLYGPEYKVYKVFNLDAKQIGWFINHEGAGHSVRTDPPTFECVNGHPNADPDSGYCSRCPGEIRNAT